MWARCGRARVWWLWWGWWGWRRWWVVWCARAAQQGVWVGVRIQTREPLPTQTRHGNGAGNRQAMAVAVAMAATRAGTRTRAAAASKRWRIVSGGGAQQAQRAGQQQWVHGAHTGRGCMWAPSVSVCAGCADVWVGVRVRRACSQHCGRTIWTDRAEQGQRRAVAGTGSQWIEEVELTAPTSKQTTRAALFLHSSLGCSMIIDDEHFIFLVLFCF